jgi:hypothetical protein
METTGFWKGQAMYAKAGDWLIVEIVGTDHGVRRAKILEVSSPDGAPPFRVRWLDTDREGLVFPGVDAYVLTQDELAALDARIADRAAAVQHHIVRQRGMS